MTERIPVTDLRAVIGQRVDAAHYDGVHTIITKAGREHAVLVSYEWYREHVDALEATGTANPG
jgi:prevent-host-death family protein